MINRIFFHLFTFVLFFSASAQKQTPKAKLTEFSVVRDTSGTSYPYAAWKNLMMLGAVTIHPVDPNTENSEFIMRRLSAEEEKSLMEKMPKPRESRSFRNGQRFTAFNETDVNGKSFMSTELKRKVIVINFWFINCPPCRMEIPELNNMVNDFKENEDVVFIGIALDSKYELQNFLKLMPFAYNIVGNGRNTASAYRVNSFPTHVVIDREGKVKFHTAGLAKNTVYWIKKSIEEAMAEPAKNTK